jgi:hypothetical protein
MLRLIVPLGLDAAIFPWGPLSLQDYLSSAGVQPPPDVFDMRVDPGIQALFVEHREVAAAIFMSLRPEATRCFVGHTLNPFLFFGVLAGAGPKFLDIALREGLFEWPRPSRTVRKHWTSVLKGLQHSYRRHVLHALTASASGAPFSIFAFSTYDYTAFNCLLFARWLKEDDPARIIILGGDYFDTILAQAVVGELSHVDGVVVGYGEEVLRLLIEHVASGRPVRSFVHAGFVAHAPDVALTGVTATFAAGSAAQEEEQLKVKYVRVDPSGKIRLLSQRGCSWGECTFCSQIDRRQYFPVKLPDLIEGLSALRTPAPPLAGAASTVRKLIVFDSDENDVRKVLPLLAIFADTSAAAQRYLAEFWLMVRAFDANLIRFLGAGAPNIEIHARMNIESLNPHTLKAMHKGATPLHGLAAVKAILDGGQYVSTNYFFDFPSETIESIIEENRLLKAAAHLLTHSRLSLSSFPYAYNGRDDIAASRDDDRLRAQRHRQDVWIKAILGVDVPFTIWAHSYSKSGPSSNSENRALSAYHEASSLNSAMQLHRAACRTFSPLSTRDTVGLRFRARVAARRLQFKLLEILTGGRALSRREELLLYLNQCKRQSQRSNGVKDRAELYIKQGHLVCKNMASAGECWYRELDKMEVDILRRLYWPQPLSALCDDEVPLRQREREDFIAEMLKAGVVIRMGNQLLSLANDPDFWLHQTLDEGAIQKAEPIRRRPVMWARPENYRPA